MSGLEIAGAAIFVLGYLFITFEHAMGIQKAPVSLVMAGLLWWLVTRTGADFERHLEEAGWEITQVVFFLLFAMTLVELISRLGFFELIRVKLQQRNWNNTRQFVVLCGLTFLLSPALDNLTTAIVMVEISRRFFRGRNLLVAAAGVVIMANAGGAWSPIGDVTTIMLWLAGKFSAGEVISQAFLPSLAHALVATALLARLVRDEANDDSVENLPLTFTPQSRVLMVAALSCFALPFVATQLDLAPFIGLGFGFGVIGVLVRLLGPGAYQPHGAVAGEPSHATQLEQDIAEMIKEVDFSSLIFFVGILLSVAALGSLGVLDTLSDSVFGVAPGFSRIAGGTVLMGWASAVIDNVPLTAVAIDAVPTTDHRLWSLMAYTVGTGGSHLIVGSAAGVVVMGRISGLTSQAYARIATVPVLLAYLAGLGVWLIQVQVFG